MRRSSGPASGMPRAMMTSDEKKMRETEVPMLLESCSLA